MRDCCVASAVRDSLVLWIWLACSTGVSRPKISTSPVIFSASTLISEMVACRVANGPSITVTESPMETSISAGADFSCSTPLPPAATGPAGFSGSGARIRNNFVERQRDWIVRCPTNPVTPGGAERFPRVHRLISQIHADEDVARELLRLTVLRWPLLDLDNFFDRNLDRKM